MAVGAVDILKNARVFERTEDAVADLGFVVVTTGRDRLMSKRVLTPEEAVAELAVEVRESRPCGILFGAERTGVTNEEVILCDAIMTIPTNPQFMSLNLAQSVAVVAYEWWKQTEIKPDFKVPAKFRRTHLANKEDLIGFFEHLEGELDRTEFLFPPEKREGMVQNLRNMWHRAELTYQEVQTLRGIIRAGVDAAIVPDTGICRLIRQLSPDFPIHGSTQMTVTSAAGVRFARSIGAELVVLARENSIAEIERIQQAQAEAGGSPLPLEVFVHGALCVAYSGQCLTSEALGGRRKLAASMVSAVFFLLLLVPTELEEVANKAINKQLVSNGETNIVLDKPRIMTAGYLTSGVKFDLLNLDGALKPYVFQARRPLSRQMKGLDDREFKGVKFMTDARYNVGYLAWWKCVRTTFN
jgi:TrmH family RNA methyltransferase